MAGDVELAATPEPEAASFPLCVDLDGTLVRTDTLHEQYLNALVRHPLAALLLLFQLVRGKAAFKRGLSRICQIDPEALPYQTDFVEFLRSEKARGRTLVFVTASDHDVATTISGHLGIFDEVMGSDGTTNLKAHAKAARLVERFGRGKFSYAGNSHADLPVWADAGEVILVNTPRGIEALVRTPIAHRFGTAATPGRSKLRLLIKAMRVYQWVKNILVFVPMLLAHVFDLDTAIEAVSMFFAFSFTASGIYILNDLLDLAADRAHPRKRRRPFASGDLSLEFGILGPALLVIGLTFAAFCISLHAFLLLLLYVVVTSAYSAYLKTKPLVDVFTLAGLYTVRLLAGGVATKIEVSVWLLGFSLFVFLSLAFLKRASELVTASAEGRKPSSRRAYRANDEVMLQVMGGASAFTSALALSLYLSSDVARQHYVAPSWLWLVVPLVLFAQCRLWLSGTRGQMTDDPIVYAVKDRVCWVAFACIAVVFVLAMHGPALTL